jgi:hypothetical protein
MLLFSFPDSFLFYTNINPANKYSFVFINHPLSFSPRGGKLYISFPPGGRLGRGLRIMTKK